MLKTPVLVAVVVLLPAVATGQTPELITDRPDQTESAVTVPKGSVQVEVGAGLSRDDEGADVETVSVGSTLVRIGWTERLELRLGWQGYVDETVELPGGAKVSADGPADGELGLKLLLAEETAGRPQLALLVATSVPFGDADLTSDEFDPSFRLAMDRSLTESIGLGINAGISWESVPQPGGGTSRESSAIYTAAVGLPAGERGGFFVEVFGEIPLSGAGSNAHSFDGGFTYLLRGNLQFDVAGGIGLSDAAEDWFVGVGLSIRLPE